MSDSIQIKANTLQNWLETGIVVSILDIRPMQQRAEAFIPQSIHFNAYDKSNANSAGFTILASSSMFCLNSISPKPK